MLQKLGIKEESLQLLELKWGAIRDGNKWKVMGIVLMHTVILVACFFVGLYINYLFGRMLLIQITGNLIGLMGPAGDMVEIGLGLMLGCIIYSFLTALLPKAEKTYLQRVGRNFLNIFFVTYGLMIMFILYAGRGIPGVDLRAIQLVPFRDIISLLSMIYHHTINLPYAYAILIGNIILFTPLAFLLRPHFKSALKCFWVLLAIFFILEALQFITNTGVFDIDDIIKYSLGVPLGFGIRKVVEKIKLRQEGALCSE